MFFKKTQSCLIQCLYVICIAFQALFPYYFFFLNLSLSSVTSNHTTKTKFKINRIVRITGFAFYFKQGYIIILKFVSLSPLVKP